MPRYCSFFPPHRARPRRIFPPYSSYWPRRAPLPPALISCTARPLALSPVPDSAPHFLSCSVRAARPHTCPSIPAPPRTPCLVLCAVPLRNSPFVPYTVAPPMPLPVSATLAPAALFRARPRLASLFVPCAVTPRNFPPISRATSPRTLRRSGPRLALAPSFSGHPPRVPHALVDVLLRQPLLCHLRSCSTPPPSCRMRPRRTFSRPFRPHLTTLLVPCAIKPRPSPVVP